MADYYTTSLIGRWLQRKPFLARVAALIILGAVAVAFAVAHRQWMAIPVVGLVVVVLVVYDGMRSRRPTGK